MDIFNSCLFSFSQNVSLNGINIAQLEKLPKNLITQMIYEFNTFTHKVSESVFSLHFRSRVSLSIDAYHFNMV